MGESMHIRGVVFDMDQTLYDRDASDAVVMGAYYDAHRSLFTAACTKEDAVRAMQKSDRAGGHFGWERIVDLLVGEGVCARRPDVHAICTFFQEGFARYGVPYPETMDTLEELHRMGLKVALITNGNPVLQRQKISHFGFDTVCDAIAIGGKPEKRVFLDMAETLGAKPGELLYVGDHPLNDIQGSRDAGYVPVWIRTMPWDYPEVERAPWEIGNVSELPCLIRARFS